MTLFRIRYTGDYLNEEGAVGVGDIALDLYEGVPFVDVDFLRDQAPPPGDAGYWDRLYSLEIEPAHVAAAEGIGHLPSLGEGRRLRRGCARPRRHRPGRRRRRHAAPWGMRLRAFSPHADPAAAAALGVELAPSLAELLAEADFVSLHNRLEPSTRGLIGAAELRLMKLGAYFINLARGEIVAQAALVEALREGRIAGAGLDVFEVEPLPLGDPLLELDNVILTPHWLPSTRDAARLTMSLISRGMLRAAQGLVPENVVNPEVLGRPGFKDKLARFRDNRLPPA